ncbi:rhodanese-like domain-containing protein [Deinococcus sp. KNUC1210]|uniref:rhodanese-like domain-containing protein n=1 Tax=Deinococcus sp. KNUC1210 TaxID=2917691 RepID=UPI00351CC0FF
MPEAVNIPLSDLTLIPELSATPVVVVCASGGRSARAAALLEGAGHSDVANLLGGTYGWMQEGRPVEFPEVEGDAQH